MGCNCRHGASSVPRRRRSAKAQTPRRSFATLCPEIERNGNDISLRLGSRYHTLYFITPVASTLSVGSFLSSNGCTGPFASALEAAELKLAYVSLSPSGLAKLKELIPSGVVSLGYLRDVLRAL